MSPVSVLRDDEAALLSRLVDRYYADIFAYLYRLVGERNQAQDLAHQVFLPRRAERRRLAHAADPRAWLYRRATRLACATVEQCRPQPWWQRWRAQPESQDGGQPDELRYGQPGPLRTALAALPFRARAALLLRGHYGLSLTETAAALDLSPRAVRSLLQSARRDVSAVYADAPDAAGAAPATRWAAPGAAAPAQAGRQPADAADGRAAAAAPGLPRLTKPANAGEPAGHAAVAALLPGYAELDPATAAAVAEHSATCSDCAAQLAVYQRLEHDLARLREAWPGRRAQDLLYAAVKGPIEESAPGAGRAAGWRPPRFAFIALLVALAIVAGAWLAGSGRLAPPVQAGAGRAAATPTASAPAPTSAPAALAPSPTPAPPEKLPAGITPQDAAWLRQHAQPFDTVQPDTASPADLLPFMRMVGDARVVALASSAPGVHEFSALQQRLVEFLIQQRNFNSLLIDSSWPQAEQLNDFIQSGSGDPQQLVLRLTGSNRQSQDLVAMVQWLRAHNQDPLSIPRFSLHGFDIMQQYSHVPMDTITAYLDQVDPEALANTQDDDRQLFRDLLSHRSDYAGKSSYMEYGRALRSAWALVQYDAYAAAGNAQDRARLRSQYAAENVLTMLRGGLSGGGNRVVLWGTTADLGVDSQAGNLGALLRQRLGQNYLVVDLDFYQGALTATSLGPHGPDGSTTVHQAAAAPAATYEEFLGLAGLPRFMLDLRPARTTPITATLAAASGPGTALPGGLLDYYRRGGPGSGGSGAAGAPPPNLDGPRPGARPPDSTATPDAPAPTPGPPPAGTAWLQGPHLTRQVASAYDDCYPEDNFASASLPERFDAVIFLQQVTPAPMLFQPATPAPPSCPAAPQNLDFSAGMAGWSKTGSDADRYLIGTDVTQSQNGQNVAYLRATRPEPTGSGILMQTFSADQFHGQRVRLSASLLADDTNNEATLWLQIDGPGGQPIARTAEPVHNADWHDVAVVADVPASATRITIGVTMASRGQVWLKAIRFDKVGQNVALTPLQ